MSFTSRLPWVGTWALLAAGAAVAQAGPPQAAPADAPFSYRSVLERYQPYSEQPVGSWPEANDTVGRIGGWRAYAREVQEAAKAKEAAEPKATGPAANPPPHGHGHPAGAPR
jgi:hypothetical protein